MTKDEALKLALEAYLCREMPAGTVISDPKWWVPRIAKAIKKALAQHDSVQAKPEPEQEPVATVIEELEHDGIGWCSTVRWLHNPVPVGETLSWGRPK